LKESINQTSYNIMITSEKIKENNDEN